MSFDAASSFECLHLRWNPFGELPADERARIACVDLVDLADHAEFLRGQRRALQLVGGHGRGKSTLLLALHRRAFPAAPYVQLRAGDAAPAASHGELSFVDSLENLGRRTRAELYRRAPGLACTTHRDLSRELERAGYTVRSVRVGIRSSAELREIVETRIEWARTRTGEPPRPTAARLEGLFGEHGDDLRSIEHELYLDYQRLKDEHGKVHARDRAS